MKQLEFINAGKCNEKNENTTSNARKCLVSWISDDGYAKDTGARIAICKTLFMDKEKLLTGKLNCEQKK